MTVKDMAREFITSSYGVSGRFFDTAWDLVSSHYEELRPDELPEGLPRSGTPLGIAGPEDSESVRAVIILGLCLTGDSTAAVLAGGAARWGSGPARA